LVDKIDLKVDFGPQNNEDIIDTALKMVFLAEKELNINLNSRYGDNSILFEAMREYCHEKF
jgi:hypothetical protein